MTYHIISTCSDPLLEAEFVRPITKIVSDWTQKRGEVFQSVIHHAGQIPFKEFEPQDKIIICGTALQDDAYLKKRENFDWLNETPTPVLGICSGMQILAQASGARVIRKDMEIGMVEITTLRVNPLCQGSFQGYSLHRNSISGLDSFEVLARSKACIHVIAHQRKPQYGVLFHPEVRQAKVLDNFLALDPGVDERAGSEHHDPGCWREDPLGASAAAPSLGPGNR